jgi:hypothetical protein
MSVQFKVVKNVTVPLLKIADDGTPIYVKALGPIFKAKDISGRVSRASKDGEPSKVTMQAPELLNVLNYETDKEAQIIVSTVLGSELRETYPNDGYVGKSFQIKKYKMQGGKRYATFEIIEISVDDHAPVNQSAQKAASKK